MIVFTIPESVILDHSIFFHFIMNDFSVWNVILFTKLVFFSRLKFAVLNYILLDVYLNFSS